MVVTMLLLATGCRSAKAQTQTIYVAQTAAGAGNGSDCADAYAVTFINTAGNWASSYTAGKVSPGTEVALCGTITSTLTMEGSGTSGSVIEFYWTTGATISQPVAQGINLGSHAYLLFDGGIPCGPGTACDTVEAANNTGYATGQAGIIEATANGSALVNQNKTSQAFYNCVGCHDIEIRNLIIRNLYVHSSLSDSTSQADSGTFLFSCTPCAGGTISIHDLTYHDMGNAISFGSTTVAASTFQLYKFDCYHDNWCATLNGTGPRTFSEHDGHVHDANNWDTTVDAFHHNNLHIFMLNSSDSLGIYLYNILSDGNWGNCCSTSQMLFSDSGSPWVDPNNENAFNNVTVANCAATPPSMEYSTVVSGVFANNTLLGCYGLSNNPNAIKIWADSAVGYFENNAIQNYAQYIVANAGTTFSTLDYNAYGPIQVTGNSAWVWNGSTMATTLAAWQTDSGGDAHAFKRSNLMMSSTGHPQNGSPLIRAGANLTSLCSGGLAPLCYDAAGNARPTTGAWDIGAYQAPAPSPPTNLTGTPR
jgi:hypothetical protein